MEKQIKTSKDIGVIAASKLLSGSGLMPNDSMSNVGSDCGSKKAIAYASYAASPATAGLRFSKSKTTGSTDCLMST